MNFTLFTAKLFFSICFFGLRKSFWLESVLQRFLFKISCRGLFFLHGMHIFEVFEKIELLVLQNLFIDVSLEPFLKVFEFQSLFYRLKVKKHHSHLLVVDILWRVTRGICEGCLIGLIKNFQMESISYPHLSNTIWRIFSKAIKWYQQFCPALHILKAFSKVWFLHLCQKSATQGYSLVSSNINHRSLLYINI